MSTAEGLLAEFEREMATTRKLLERVPEDKLTWKPHAKSMSLGGLSTHLSNLPTWGVITSRSTSISAERFGWLAI